MDTNDTEETKRPADERDGRTAETDIGVLVVDDEPAVTILYEEWLSQYRVSVANGGKEALSFLERHANEVDVVLLDRKMPGMSGDEVLSELRDRGYDCRVAMLTAIAPSYDIVDMPFDDYISKPVDRDMLCETVENLYERAEYADTLARYYSLVSKHAVLTAELPARELKENDAFAEIEAGLREAERKLDSTSRLTDHQEFQYLLRELD